MTQGIAAFGRDLDSVRQGLKDAAVKPVPRHPVIQTCVDADPSLAFARSIGAMRMRQVLRRQTGHCTWCNGQVPRGRTFWCSQACVDSGNKYRFSAVLMGKVAAGDDFTCRICGNDGNEVNHIHPVIWGGGLCNEDNLETLCKSCHARKTTKLHRALRTIKSLKQNGR